MKSINIQRKIIAKWAQKNLVGNEFLSPIGIINITMIGINKTLWQQHNNIIEKNNAIYNLPEILLNSIHFQSIIDKKGKVKFIHFLETTIANKKSYIMIKESFNGDKNFYNIQDFNPGNTNNQIENS